jgi:hypothetical protein
MKRVAVMLALCLVSQIAHGATRFEDIVSCVKRLKATGSQKGVTVTQYVKTITHDERGFDFCQIAAADAPAGTVTYEVNYRIEFAALGNTSCRIEDTKNGVVKFIVHAPLGMRPFATTVRQEATGAYTKNVNPSEKVTGMESYFGFSCSNMTEAMELKLIWTDFVSKLATTSKPANLAPADKLAKSATVNPTQPAVHRTTIIGSTKDEIDTLLKGWSIRRSNRSTEQRPIYYCTQDVDIIVTFMQGKAIGVAVVDRPSAGVKGITPRRFEELIALIGGGRPKAADVLQDSSGIREFSIGDVD